MAHDCFGDVARQLLRSVSTNSKVRTQLWPKGTPSRLLSRSIASQNLTHPMNETPWHDRMVVGSYFPQAARERREAAMGARLSCNRKGARRRFSVSWVGLCRGWIARCTFGRGIPTWTANSVIPIARMILARAYCTVRPSSMAAKRKARANAVAEPSRKIDVPVFTAPRHACPPSSHSNTPVRAEYPPAGRLCVHQGAIE